MLRHRAACTGLRPCTGLKFTVPANIPIFQYRTLFVSNARRDRGPPLFHLDRAIFPKLQDVLPMLSLTIRNDPEQLWAIIAPPVSRGPGMAVLDVLLSTLAGISRPMQRPENASNDPLHLHPKPHPFSQKYHGLVSLASFSKQQEKSTSNEFQDFSKRYGALREQDTVTLFEKLMETQGFEVGKVAALNILPDKLTDETVDPQVREHAHATKQRILVLAPLLGLHKPGPGSPGGTPLLYQPTISLSNGQLRRARIMHALIELQEGVYNAQLPYESATSLLVLDRPYSGLDEPSRDELSSLLASLHHKGQPCVIQVLRRQDEVPQQVTHIVDIDAHGNVWSGPKQEWYGNQLIRPKGVEGIRQNYKKNIGVGSGESLVNLHNVTIQYGDKKVLDVSRKSLQSP